VCRSFDEQVYKRLAIDIHDHARVCGLFEYA
jgi:hypothetical protein